MAAIAPITISDSTPTNHVFHPKQTTPFAGYRRDGVTGQAVVAQERLSMKVTPAKTVNGVNRVLVQLVVPVSETPSGGAATGYVAPPAIAHEMKVNVEFFLHQRSDLVGRRDLRILLANLLSDAQVAGIVDNLEAPY